MTPETWYEHARKAIKRSLPPVPEDRPTFEVFVDQWQPGLGNCDQTCLDRDCIINGCTHHRADK
jgi:hypothetical protein